MVILGILDTSGSIHIGVWVPDFMNNPFIHPAGILIVFGGIVSAMFIMYPSDIVFQAMGAIKYLFSHSESKVTSLYEDSDKIVSWAESIKKNRIGFFNDLKNTKVDAFTNTLFELYNTNYSKEEIRQMGEASIEKEFSKSQIIADVIHSAAVSAPAFGMVGTVLGMVIMLSNMDDPTNIGPAMSTGLIGTLYGVMAANLLFNPLSKKIKHNAYNTQIKEHLVLEAIIMIKDNKSTLAIRDKLYSLIGRKTETKSK